ncbi:MAG: hypothetical protein WCC04_08980 [Terriglobales bacterium]
MCRIASPKLGQNGRIVCEPGPSRIRKTFGASRVVLAIVLGSASLAGQQKPASPNPSAQIELPVLMQQKVVAGKTRPGTKVHARLAIATLVNNVVVPEGAILSGEVTESVPRSATGPSRLAICMDSAQGKDRSVPIKVYLTAWYYPAETSTEELSPSDAANPTTSPIGGFPRRVRNPTLSPFPRGDPEPATLPVSSVSQHRVLMKNVEPMRNSAGVVTLTSTHSTLKLDKRTVYVLAADGLLPQSKRRTLH